MVRTETMMWIKYFFGKKAWYAASRILRTIEEGYYEQLVANVHDGSKE
jgi:hypothetical protein